ncbi:MFS transporter [Sorangium sp. So ce513]|uniref:MFS transporter n=1 Tax=Sorangium sp. So ce513 TaxID=3133315 RepID=UPI003F60902D
MATRDAEKTPLTRYQWRLLAFLSVASFFEGYDRMAITQILPNLGEEMGLSAKGEGLLIGVISLGSMLAFLLVRKADHWGRRRLLTITIAGYTIFSLFTGLAPNVIVFAGCQLLARIFLVAEYAVSVVYAAEEFPKDRRGLAIGLIEAFSSLGIVTCAGLVPMFLSTELGWRTIYFVGAIPLVLIALGRRGLRETARFEQLVIERKREDSQPFTRILTSAYRGRMLMLATIWALMFVCLQNGVTFWKTFATRERGLTDSQVGTSIMIAALAAMPLVFLSGKLIDTLGRRTGAVITFTLAAAGVLGGYSLHSHAGLTISLALSIFGGSAVLPVLNAYTTELFPTHLRSDALAWSNNLLGRLAYMLSPVFLGIAAERVGWGPAMSATVIFPLIALGLILWFLPETRGKELEETARV